MPGSFLLSIICPPRSLPEVERMAREGKLDDVVMRVVERMRDEA